MTIRGLALLTVSVVSAISGTAPSAEAAAAPYCNKLCAIGFHCVPTPKGGVCVPGDSVAALASCGDETEETTSSAMATEAATPFCNKLCIIGFHCVPTSKGGVCVRVGSSEIGEGQVALDLDVERVPTAAPICDPCTILCPVGTHLVQTGNCQCKCVGNQP